ncbi:MAG: ATP-binding protein [Bacteroidetes bacterium]|nr:ATP-binding protein [Bacteroidota bacterium]
MIRIAITGPESTGKSWLAENLARHYQVNWVKEYAREYLEKSDGHYEYNDILKIAKGQLEREEQAALAPAQLLFLDTDFFVTRIWCEVKYGKVHPWILNQLETHRYDLYLLCDIDLPWEADPLREHPELRKYLFDKYYQIMTEMNMPFRVISGQGRERLELAISFIDNMLQINKLP